MTYDFEKHLKDVVARQSDLSTFGWRFKTSGEAWNSGERFDVNRTGMDSDDFALEVRDAMRWIRSHPDLISKLSSYSGKAKAEKAAGRYVSNGAFIIATIMLGVPVIRLHTGPNCNFKKPEAVQNANAVYELYQSQKTLEEWGSTIEPELAEFCLRKFGSLAAAYDDFRGELLDVMGCVMEQYDAWQSAEAI